MLRTLTRLVVPIVLVAGCSDDSGSSPTPDTSVADASTDTSNDAADVTAAGACDPTPARCDALGTDRPSRLSEHGVGYVQESAEMVVFGGTTAVPDNCSPSVESRYVDTTWIYDDACGAWTELDVAGPGPRGRHAMTAGGGFVWLHGGRWREDGATSGDYSVYGDLWRFDMATQTWTEMNPSGAAPSARVNHSMVWDSSRDQVVLFGGSEVTGLNIAPKNDVWVYDVASDTWLMLSDGEGPDARLSAATTYDAQRDALIVFSGFDDFGFTGVIEYFADVWAFDLAGESWEQLQNEASAPDGRFGSAIVHDPTNDLYVTFGGHDDQTLGNRNDNWAFDPNTRAWTDLAIGDTFQNEQTGICEFPPDFTDIDPALPERRSYGTMVWSETCGHAVLFAGKTDCGAANDIWTYADGAWTEVVEASAGEVCHRFRDNRDNCANLCF